MVASCKKPVTDDVTKKKAGKQFDGTTDCYVSKGLATSYVRMAYQEYANGEYGSEDTSSVPEIQNTLYVSDLEGRTAMWIFDFGYGQGYVIMSADYRVEPVLAYSDTGSFNTNPGITDSLNLATLPYGLACWFWNERTKIGRLRDSLVDSTVIDDIVLLRWNELRPTATRCPRLDPGCDKGNISTYHYTGGRFGGPGDNSLCTTYNSNVGPLVVTHWDQGSDYHGNYFNANIPSGSGCSSGDLPGNGNWWAGCEAVAAAQVMAYHSYPTSIAWSSMNAITATGALPALLKDIDDNNVATYYCGGTAALTGLTRDALVNHYNYQSSAIYTDFPSHISTVKSNLDNHDPVIMDGYTVLAFGVIFEGHCWVCDGYESRTNCPITDDSFHMNWGWGGGWPYNSYDGWYHVGGWTPGGNNFNFLPGVIINIVP